jgi:type II secretory pathway component PulF
MRQWGMGLLVLGIMFGVGLAVLTDVQDQFNESETAYDAVQDTIDAISEFTGWFGLIVLVIVAAIIIRLVTQGFGRSGGGGGRMSRGRA